ncbi:MAG TPA: APC family permease [Pyrinomonadaceae bacterium]
MNDERDTANPASDLRRDLRLIDAVGIGLGAIIGAGIFVVTGVAAGVAGPAFLIGLLLAGLAATCNALSSAELAATYPESGGTYEYGYRLIHPIAGFTAGWMYLAGKLAAGGMVALGFPGVFRATGSRRAGPLRGDRCRRCGVYDLAVLLHREPRRTSPQTRAQALSELDRDPRSFVLPSPGGFASAIHDLDRPRPPGRWPLDATSVSMAEWKTGVIKKHSHSATITRSP